MRMSGLYNVKDKLPEIHEYVLALEVSEQTEADEPWVNKKGETRYDEFDMDWSFAYIDENGKWYGDGGTVTYWTPLPKLPDEYLPMDEDNDAMG